MIDFEGAGFSYGRPALLQDLTLTLTPGTFHILYGAPGSGKTTLLRLCRLDLVPTAGRIRFFGGTVDPRNRDAIAALRRTLGVVDADSPFLDHLSVAANVALPLVASGAGAAGREADLQALLEWVGLGPRAEALPPELTRAERQCAALARALILSPALLLADDPMAGLDWDGAERLLALLVELNRMGKAILLATHDSDLVHAAAERAPLRLLHLDRGRVSEPEADPEPETPGAMREEIGAGAGPRSVSDDGDTALPAAEGVSS